MYIYLSIPLYTHIYIYIYIYIYTYMYERNRFSKMLNAYINKANSCLDITLIRLDKDMQACNEAAPNRGPLQTPMLTILLYSL